MHSSCPVRAPTPDAQRSARLGMHNLATATTIAALVVAGLAVGCSKDSSDGAPSTGTPSSVTSTPPTPGSGSTTAPSSSSSGPGPTATTAPTATVYNCTEQDIETTGATGSPEGAHVFYSIPLRNRSDHACWLEGPVDVTFPDQNGTVMAQAEPSAALPAEHVVLVPGDSAHVFLDDRVDLLTDPSCGPVVRSSTVRIYRPQWFDLTPNLSIDLCTNPVGQFKAATIQPGAGRNLSEGAL